jgi:hypothetical protein
MAPGLLHYIMRTLWEVSVRERGDLRRASFQFTIDSMADFAASAVTADHILRMDSVDLSIHIGDCGFDTLAGLSQRIQLPSEMVVNKWVLLDFGLQPGLED